MTTLVVFLVFHQCAGNKTSRRDLIPETSPREELRKDRQNIGALKVIYGTASFYGRDFHNKKTASGEPFDMNANTAAHPSLPFGTLCRVTNLDNNKSVIVRINDRGPFVANRVLDLSYGAAQQLDGVASGLINVKIEILKYGQQN